MVTTITFKGKRKKTFLSCTTEFYVYNLLFFLKKEPRFLKKTLTTKELRTNALYSSHFNCWNKAPLFLV